MSLRASSAAFDSGDTDKAAALLDQANPVATVKKYEEYAASLGMTRGDLGLLILMNLKWYPAFVGQNQTLGREAYRISFGPTVFEPLAQGSGNRSFHLDADKKLWTVQGERELKGREWTLPENATSRTDKLSKSEKEIVRTGMEWETEVKIPVIPVMKSHYAPKNTGLASTKPRKLKLYVNGAFGSEQETSEFEVSLNDSVKLGTVSPRPGVAEAVEFDIENEVEHIVLKPIRGKIYLCGLRMETMNNE